MTIHKPHTLTFPRRRILNCLVQNEPGVLSRVSGILAGRGFNIDSLVVCRTEIRDLSRMSIVISGQEGVVEQARRQLEDLVSNESVHRSTNLTFGKVPVWAVLDYTETRTISRELLLVKVSILGPEYIDDQLLGGSSHDPRPVQQIPIEDEGHHHDSKLLDREVLLAQSFERSGKSDKPTGAAPPAPSPSPPPQLTSTPPTNYTPPNEPAPLTASQLLQLKHGNLAAISTLSAQFGGKIVDVSEWSIIVELSAKSHRVESFLSLLRPFGILESARTGARQCYHQTQSFSHALLLQASWLWLGLLFQHSVRRKRPTKMVQWMLVSSLLGKSIFNRRGRHKKDLQAILRRSFVLHLLL